MKFVTLFVTLKTVNFPIGVIKFHLDPRPCDWQIN